MFVWYLQDKDSGRMVRSPDGHFFKAASRETAEQIIVDLKSKGFVGDNLEPIKAGRRYFGRVGGAAS